MGEYPAESFVFYRSFFEAISEMDDKCKLETYNALCEYALYGKEPNLSNAIERAVFAVCKPNIDSNTSRRENGKKGGRPSKKSKDTEQETIGFNQENHRIQKAESNENENENENENVSVTETEKWGGTPTDLGLSRVMDAFMEKINPSPSSSSLDELKGYYEKMDAECCLKAIDNALDNGKRTWSYIKGILQNKLKEGIRNIDDWNRAEDEYKQRKEKAKSDAEKGGFIPPTVEEVRAYCKAHKCNVDPEHFVYYFKARGWKFANNQPMVDWESAVMSWDSGPQKYGSDESDNGLPFLT